MIRHLCESHVNSGSPYDDTCQRIHVYFPLQGMYIHRKRDEEAPIMFLLIPFGLREYDANMIFYSASISTVVTDTIEIGFFGFPPVLPISTSSVSAILSTVAISRT